MRELTLRELYFEERGPMNGRGMESNRYRLQLGGYAVYAFKKAQKRLADWRECWDSQPDPVKLARFYRAQTVTDPRKLYAMLPAWIKAHDKSVAPPKPFVFVPNLPPKFPSWCNTPSIGRVTHKMLVDCQWEKERNEWIYQSLKLIAA